MGKNRRKVSLRAAFCLLTLFTLLSSEDTLAQKEDAVKLTVLLFNYSNASTTVLASAEGEAGRIFSQSGIRLVWTQCPVLSNLKSPSDCMGEPMPGQIRVRILPRHLSDAFQDNIFGFAVAPFWATVFFDSALRLSQSEMGSDAYVNVMLGSLIAHEFGHLLLGEHAHTVKGIMQPRWGIRQIQQVLMGALAFTPEQCRLMLQNARKPDKSKSRRR